MPNIYVEEMELVKSASILLRKEYPVLAENLNEVVKRLYAERKRINDKTWDYILERRKTDKHYGRRVYRKRDGTMSWK